MADQTTTAEVKKPDPKPPLAAFAADPVKPIASDEPAESGAAARLRAFEDEKLGADIHRINGRIERGSGSFFKTKMTDADRARHAALEHLVEVEGKLEAAKSALGQAEVEYAEAEVAVNNA